MDYRLKNKSELVELCISRLNIVEKDQKKIARLKKDKLIEMLENNKDNLDPQIDQQIDQQLDQQIEKKDDTNEFYPDAIYKNKVGTYPIRAYSGGGYFYDVVLEYRVWSRSSFYPFATYKEAKDFASKNKHYKNCMALVRQLEYIDEPETGKYIHVKKQRDTEWRVEWLKDSKRTPDSISTFLQSKLQDTS